MGLSFNHSMENTDNVMGFFLACRNTDIRTAKELLKLVDPSSLLKAEWEGRTCFHVAVIAGDQDLFRELAGLFRELAPKLPVQDWKDIMKKVDKKGNTALHLAVRKNYVDLTKHLVELEADLCDCVNNERETPLKLAASLGFKEAVEFLTTPTSNALHCVVELNQVELVHFLKERNHGKLSALINNPYQPPTTNDADRGNCATKSSVNGGNCATNNHPIVLIGDTPLHIAARNRYDHMVNLLLKVRGVDKSARNSEDKTPYEIAREVTQYHESFRVIRKLADCERNPKAFMECVPQVSNEKRVRAREGVEEAYKARRDAELVVAGLLATMTCAAAFTVPGGFESKNVKDRGSPNLVSLVSFKLFFIFDCVSFFLSLFVCIMWEMSCELTTGDKMLFMTINSLVVCFSFGFTAYGFMCAVYVMLQRKVKIFSWVVLGILIAIIFWAHVAFFHQSAQFVVKRARFHRLCGVSRRFDDTVERVWSRAERCGLLRRLRKGEDVSQDLITGHAMCCGLEKFLRSNDDINTGGPTPEHEVSLNNSPLSATNQLHSRSASPLLNRTR